MSFQVLNDLLDPSRANLKLREDPKRGFYVEGIKEETLVSAEHALSVIATGVAHRKVRPQYHSLVQATALHSTCFTAHAGLPLVCAACENPVITSSLMLLAAMWCRCTVACQEMWQTAMLLVLDMQ